MNHLLIGLGGTGGRILKAFRKLVYQQFREEEPDGLILDYLFIDSDPKSFRDNDPGWSVLGKSVQLPKRNQMLIAEANLTAVIQDLNSHPNLKPWLGDRATWGEILSSLNIDAAGGQKRRLGRFLFAMNVKRFRDSVTTLVRDMQDRGKRNDVTFHVFCGLAGGTGSGAIVDVIAQLRALFPDKAQRILVYAYVPDLNPPANWNTGNYHANAYASLLELNAMSAGTWAPCDVSSGGTVKSDFWFNGCYVYSDENEQGFRASIESELPDIVADFVFHKTVVARKVAWDDLSRFENAENGDGSPEAIAGTGKGLRSVRFLSFGIRRLAFPEESIRELLTYEFALQSFRQLQFNNWQEGLGFIEQARPQTNAEFVTDQKTRDDWRLSDEHLRLIRPIIDSEGSRRWRGYDQEWGEFESHYLQLVKQTDKLKWLGELKRLFSSAWEEGFRGVGVKPFFQTAERDVQSLAEAVRDRVEASLFEDWRTGARSLNECARLVAALMEDLNLRLSKVDDFAAKRVESAEHLARQVLTIEAEWNNTRILDALLNSRERDIGKAALALREQSVARTLAEAARFSKKLILNILDQMADLKASIDSGEAALGAAADQATKTIANRLPRENNSADLHAENGYVVSIENAKGVDTVRRRLVADEEEQRVQTAAVRADIVARLGQTPTFRLFNRRMAEGEIRNAIVARSEENVRSAHQRLVTEQRERVIGVSVIEKLQDRWGVDKDRLTREATALAGAAGRFLAFDPTEQNKHFEGRSAAPRAVEAFAVMLPQPAEHKEFVDQLKSAFKDARPGRVSFVASNERINEITLVTLVNLFPLRFARTLKALKERYEARLSQLGRARAALEVHIEGDGSLLPDLFIADDAQVARRARPVLLLADALALIKENSDPASGQTRIIHARRDNDGFELEPLVLGRSFPEVLDGATEKTVMELITAIRSNLASQVTGSPEFQSKIRDAMLARIESIKSLLPPRLVEVDMVQWNAAARDAMKTIRGEAEL